MHSYLAPSKNPIDYGDVGVNYSLGASGAAAVFLLAQQGFFAASSFASPEGFSAVFSFVESQGFFSALAAFESQGFFSAAVSLIVSLFGVLQGFLVDAVLGVSAAEGATLRGPAASSVLTEVA